MQIDSIIVGQGLAGTLLAHQLTKRGHQVMVIDKSRVNSASKVAGGLYNPITGHRKVKTWLADQLFPSIETYYEELEEFLKTSFLHKSQIFRPFDTIAEQNVWFAQSTEPGFKDLVKAVAKEDQVLAHFKFPFGGLVSKIGGFVDVPSLLSDFRKYLKINNLIIEESLDYHKLQVKEDQVTYGELVADSVVFCEGIYGKTNPYFDYLPLNGTKGEVLDIKVPEYFVEMVVNKGVFVIPKGEFQSVGSNYEWNYSDEDPSGKGLTEITSKLDKILCAPYDIVGHRAGVRPTVSDHRPLLGRHPEHKGVYVFNGMGTKGVSLTPYFSAMFAEHLTEGRNLMPEADIKRFDYLYRSK